MISHSRAWYLALAQHLGHPGYLSLEEIATAAADPLWMLGRK